MTADGNRRIRFTLKQGLGAVVVITVVLGAIYNGLRARQFAQLDSENRRLAEEVAALELEAELKQLENDLKAPMEAIVLGDVPWSETEAVRKAALSKAGISRYPQFSSVYLHGAPDFDLPTKEHKPGEGETYCNVSILGSISDGSYLSFWINHPPQTCGRLTFELRNDGIVGRHLRDNPDVFRERFRPLLLRLILSTRPWIRCEACETLIVAGDRTRAVLDVVGDFVREPKQTVWVDDKQVQRDSSEKAKCLKLVQEFDLDITVDDNPEAT